MKRKPNVWIVSAAYNEASRIGTVLKSLKRHGYRNIIVVDDCSRDATAQIAKKAGALVIRHKRNMGQGAGLRTGIKEAVKRKADIIVTFDSDGQHDAREIKKMVLPISSGKAEVVLGSRFLGKHPGMPFYKWVTLQGSKLVERLLLGVRLTDVHNGFRAFSRAAARKVQITCDGMTHASEIVYEVKQKDLSYVERPVTIKYDAYAKGKGQSIFNSFRILAALLRMKRKKRLRKRFI